MRRGRIFIYLALIIILGVAAVALYFWTRRSTGKPGPSGTQTTPQARYIEIITAGQNIYPGAPIAEDMLSSVQIPEDKLVEGEITNKTDLVNKYAKIQIAQGIIITTSMVSDTPGSVNLPGSSWSPFIPQGMTAVAIPITRLSSVAYGIRDGDYVNVIVTMLLVDIDPTFQSVLPNLTADVLAPGPSSNGVLLTGSVSTSNNSAKTGRSELDDTLKQPFYVVPSESQRPRMVTQMIMQNTQVLHVGSFPLPGENVSDQLNASAPSAGPTPTPQPAGAVGEVKRPDIITLMVTPQDAVTLTYLIYNGAFVTLTLRNPNDQKAATQPEAANLEYLLTQYNIPIPAKLPYSVEPRVNQLQQPHLPNDIVATPGP
jgi:pilus assembly protein CpaB